LGLKESSLCHINHNKMVFWTQKQKFIWQYPCNVVTCFFGQSFINSQLTSNRSPTKDVTNNMTPYGMWFGCKFFLSHFLKNCCKVYALIQKKRCQKLDFHIFYCVFLEYSKKSKVYWSMCPNNYNIFISSNGFFMISLSKQSPFIRENKRWPKPSS